MEKSRKGRDNKRYYQTFNGLIPVCGSNTTDGNEVRVATDWQGGGLVAHRR